jgi:cytochrome c oxidase cbb3-type subunit 3
LPSVELPVAAARAGRLRRLAGLALLVVLVAAVLVWAQRGSTYARLVRTEPHQVLKDPGLLAVALRLGAPLYERHCAHCHGAALQGDPRRGVPDLARGAWLYGDDPVDVEHTIYYGIRSGHPKARNLTDMPALVRTGQISAQDARDAVEFLQSIADRPHDEAAALRGQSIYYNKGNCYDCHAHDARGVTDYGTPALTGPEYLYGGDRETLYQSILNGRHGECPAWVTVLTPVQIRALALYLVATPRANPKPN